MGENKKKKDYKFIGLIAVEILFILTWIVLSFTGNKEIIHINPSSFTGSISGDDANGISIS